MISRSKLSALSDLLGVLVPSGGVAWLTALCLVLLLPYPALAGQRVALLIGNQGYAQGGLRYPSQDVGHIKAALLDIGFQARDVVVLLDADQKAVKRALSAFGERARGAEVAFLYYSGHATQARGQNWLIPIGAEIRTEADYEIEAVSAQGALAQLQEAAPALSIVVLDACRDNPVAVTKSGTKGLGRMDAGASTVLAYATSPNDTAADNGLYAQVLAAQLRLPGKEILDVFRDTGAEVRKRTKDTAKPQAPRMSEVDVPRRFYLASAPPPPPVVDTELERWTAALRANTEAAYTDFLRTHPQGAYASAARNALAALKPPAPVPVPSPAPVVVEAVGAAWRDCAECPELVGLPTGRFTMGSPEGEAGRDADEGPQRPVEINYRLAVGRLEVTRGQFARFVQASGYRTEAEQNAGGVKGCAVWTGQKWEYTEGRDWRQPGFEQTDEHPVVCVSWNDAQAYVKWLNSQVPGKGYRLLSEAEWEYAARAGSSTRMPWGDDPQATAQCAWANGADAAAKAKVPGAGRWAVAACDDGSAYDDGGDYSDGAAYTAAGGRYKANAFGLRDMAGNAREWVQDLWHDNYSGAPSDGSAWVSGGDQTRRVFRGGSWGGDPRGLRSANRSGGWLVGRMSDIGFRIARTN